MRMGYQIAPVINKTDAELTAMWWQYAADRTNHELRNRILAKYERLMAFAIRKFMREFNKPHDAFDDYLGAAWMIMAKTAEQYDPSQPFQFSTILVRNIRWRMHRTIGQVLSEGVKQFRRLQAKRRRVSHHLGYRANDFDLAEFSQLDEGKLSTQIRRCAAAVQVFGGDDHCRHDIAKVEDPSDRITTSDALEFALQGLREVDRELLTRIHSDGETEAAIAREQGISKQRISQLNLAAIARVRAKLEGRVYSPPPRSPSKPSEMQLKEFFERRQEARREAGRQQILAEAIKQNLRKNAPLIIEPRVKAVDGVPAKPPRAVPSWAIKLASRRGSDT